MHTKPTETEPPSRSTIRGDRAEILRFAARLTVDPDIPEAVIAHARVLHAWMDAAPDEEDRLDRLTALRHADNNRPTPRDADDNPALLLAEAEVYYAFLRPGGTDTRPGETGSDETKELR